MSQPIFQKTNDLNRFIREYGLAKLSNDTPAAPEGYHNITWNTDTDGNLAAYVPNAATFNPRGAWNSSTSYSQNDVVTFGNSSYLSIVSNNVGNEPDTSPSDWQILAGGTGTVIPGQEFTLPMYQSGSDSTTVQSSSITTDSEGQNINIPGVTAQLYTIESTSGPASAFPASDQQTATMTVTGPALNVGPVGNTGGWTSGSNHFVTGQFASRGIWQSRGSFNYRHSVGDAAGMYSYVFTDGGSCTNSDEGTTGISTLTQQNPGFFNGVVASTTGQGDINPELTFVSGNNWCTDGAFLLNISKGTLMGSLNGNATNLAGTTISVIPTTGVTLPITEACGITNQSVAWNGNTQDVATPVTLNLTLQSINGTTPQFQVGQHVTVAGTYVEQSFITQASAPVNGVQTVQLNLRNPQQAGFFVAVFAGGIAGQYLSMDASYNFENLGIRTSYFAFGSFTGTDLICGALSSVVGITPIPFFPESIATTTGANAAFHLYPGAEVVVNKSFDTASVTLEQNNVNWEVGDVVENPHYPIWQGAQSKHQVTAYYPAPQGMVGNQIIAGGTAFVGPTTFGMQVFNLNPLNYYLGNGGPLEAPAAALNVQGPFNNGLIFQFGPDSASNGGLIFVQNRTAPNPGEVTVISLNYALGGNLTFDDSTTIAGTWGVDGFFNAGGYVYRGIRGADGSFTSADGKTVTVQGGLVTGIA